MPLNVPGLLVPIHLLARPRLVVPALIAQDIRHIDFRALKRAGYRGAVFDKDNCLTLPHRDTLVPELQSAWKTCRETFGEGNVLIVSNSAGTYLDAGGIQSESVTYHLEVPVLRHEAFKPAYSCISAVRTYFLSLRNPIRDSELIVVGDRIFTDVVMANRMRAQAIRSRRSIGHPAALANDEDVGSTTKAEEPDHVPQGPLAIWTTGVWERESMVMRWLERSLVKAVERWSTPLAGENRNLSSFIQEVVKPEPPKKPTLFEGILSRLGRA